jgi:type I restriction enzyme S subunit
LVIRPSSDISSSYLKYYFLSRDFINTVDSSTYGSKMPRASWDYIGNLPLLIPSDREQQAIVDFLDHKTARIDELIAKKQSLLGKLAEQRSALISQAVTKGLDPSIPKKDSGAAWLGKIPAHWSTSRVKFVSKVGNGSTPSRDNPDYWFDGDFPWLNSSVVNKEVVDSADQFVTGVALKECHLPIIEPPAVLVGITGQGKTRGMSSKLTFRATINQHLVYVKPYGDSISVDYLLYIFKRAYAYLRNESDAGGSTKGAITCTQIENLAIPLPPLAEQEEVVRFVDNDYSRISHLRKKIEAALQSLREYRSALITNAVTGKIDVRNYMSSINATHSEVMR